MEIPVLGVPTKDDFTYPLPQSVTYDGQSHAADVTVKSGITGMGSYKVLYNGSETAPVNAGTYTVTLQVAKGALYAAANLDLGTLIINKATPTITVFSNSLTMVKGTSHPLNAAVIPTGLSLDYSSSAPSVATVDADGTVHGVAVGTATYDGAAVAGTWSWSSMAPTDVGTYSVLVTFTPQDSDTYISVNRNIMVAISKATPTGCPDYTAISNSGNSGNSDKTLKDAALTTGSFTVSGAIQWEDPEPTEVKANTSYKWIFIPNDADNYNIATGALNCGTGVSLPAAPPLSPLWSRMAQLRSRLNPLLL